MLVWMNWSCMDVRSAFLNWYIDEEVYVSQLPRFEDHKYPDMSSNSRKLFMVWSNHLDSGMRGWVISFFLKAMREEKQIRLYSLRKHAIKLYLFKFMLITSYLVQLMKLCVSSLWKPYRVNLRCPRWENSIIFLACKLTNSSMVHSLVNPNITVSYWRNLIWKIARRQPHLLLLDAIWILMRKEPMLIKLNTEGS